MESAMTTILLDASGKMHRRILFDRRLGRDHSNVLAPNDALLLKFEKR